MDKLASAKFMMSSTAVSIAAVSLLSFVSQIPSPQPGRTVTLPCISDYVSTTGDDSALLVECREDKGKRLVLIDLKTLRSVPMIVTGGILQVSAAPRGRVVAVRTEQNELLIFDDAKRASYQVPFGVHEVWSADGSRLYFDAEIATDITGFTTLGILDVARGTILRRRLRETSEHLEICDRTGHLFADHWRSSGSNNPRWTDEYDAGGRFVGTATLGLQYFSAGCVYASAFPSNHGPDSFSIYETRTGAVLKTFPFDFDERVDNAWGLEWNPVVPRLALLYRTPKGGGPENAEVWDMNIMKPLLTLPLTVRPIDSLVPSAWALWSQDGRNLIIVDGAEARFYPVPRGTPARAPSAFDSSAVPLTVANRRGY